MSAKSDSYTSRETWLQYRASPSDKLRNEIAQQNYRLVPLVLSRAFSQIPIEWQEDLLQEGWIGLLRAVERYDCDDESQASFSTFAFYVIRQSMGRYLDNTRSTIRLPVHISDQIRRVERLRTIYIHQNGSVPSLEELSEFTGIPELKLFELSLAADTSNPGSLEAPMGSEDSVTLYDLLQNPDATDPLTELLSKGAQHLPDDVSLEALSMVLRELSTEEYEILIRRANEETLALIGQRFGYTREYIRQKESRALAYVRGRFGYRLIGKEIVKWEEVAPVVVKITQETKPPTRSEYSKSSNEKVGQPKNRVQPKPKRGLRSELRRALDRLKHRK